MTKTVMEMMTVIGKNIDDIQGIDNVSQSAREITLQRAQGTATLAKQFMNGAKLIEQGDGMIGRHEATEAIIGYYTKEHK